MILLDAAADISMLERHAEVNQGRITIDHGRQ